MSTNRTEQFERVLDSWKQGKPSLTVEAARHYLAAYPDESSILQMLADALRSLAQYDDAETACARALAVAPPGLAYRVHRAIGRIKEERGQTELAEQAFRQAIDAAPHDASAYIYLGAMHAGRGRLTDAEECYRAATRCSDGEISEVWLNLGLVLRAQRRFHEAAAALQQALVLDPAYDQARDALTDVNDVLSGRAEA